jgi:hypothetical protein
MVYFPRFTERKNQSDELYGYYRPHRINPLVLVF